MITFTILIYSQVISDHDTILTINMLDTYLNNRNTIAQKNLCLYNLLVGRINSRVACLPQDFRKFYFFNEWIGLCSHGCPGKVGFVYVGR